MFIPQAKDIATRRIVSININNTIEAAFNKMLESEHRDIIVEDEKTYYLFEALDTVHLYEMKIDFTDSLHTLALHKLTLVTKETSVLDLLPFVKQDIRYIGVTESDGNLYGLITNTDIVSAIDPQTLMHNYTVEDFILLKQKDKSEYISPEMTTQEAFERMYKNRQSYILIVKDYKALGILTTKDFIHLIKRNEDLSQPVTAYMSSPVVTVHKNNTLYQTLSLLQEKQIQRVAAVDDNGKLLYVIGQKELITLSYSKWINFLEMKEKELQNHNTQLQAEKEKFKHLATKDKLTGLFNRVQLDQFFTTSENIMDNTENAISVIMLDIDHFKKVNDTYGHLTGDNVLKELAATLIKSTRASDIIIRWGGEEFIILLFSAHLQTAVKIAQTLRKKIEEIDVVDLPKFTVSLGVAEVLRNESLEDVITKVDTLLYKAKKLGRNRVEYVQT